MNGHITIGRIGYKDSDAIHIRIEDDTSHIAFLDVYLSLENFSKVLTSSHVDCKFELRGVQNVGKKLETKTEIVPLANPYMTTDEARKEALKPFEVDGWKARVSDISNHHRYQKESVSVTFSRFVEE